MEGFSIYSRRSDLVGLCVMLRTVQFLSIVAAALVASGCVAHASRLHPVRTAFHGGNLAEAERLIGDHLDRHPRERDVLRLDLAMLALSNLVQDGDDAEAHSLQVADKQRAIVAAALDVGAVAREATENAGTRCWGLLPDTIQVLRLELPVGQHTLALRPVGRNGQPTGPAIPQSVTVLDGRNTYVVVQATDTRIIGRPLTNSP